MGTNKASSLHAFTLIDMLRVAKKEQAVQQIYGISIEEKKNKSFIERKLDDILQDELTVYLYGTKGDVKEYKENVQDKNIIVPDGYECFVHTSPNATTSVTVQTLKSRVSVDGKTTKMTPATLELDLTKFLCVLLFGPHWDTHLGDLYDVLGVSKLETFGSGRLEGLFKESSDYFLIGKQRMGMNDLVIKSTVRYIQEEADREMSLSSTPSLVGRAIEEIKRLFARYLPKAVALLRVPDTPENEVLDVERVVADLLLAKICDSVHSLRNVDIQRILFSIDINLAKCGSATASSSEYFETATDVPAQSLVGLCGYSGLFSGNNLSLIWDDISRRVVGVSRTVNTNVLSDETAIARIREKFQGDMQHVTEYKQLLDRVTRKRLAVSGTPPQYYNEKRIRDAIQKEFDTPPRSATEAFTLPSPARSVFSSIRDVFETGALRSIGDADATNMVRAIADDASAIAIAKGTDEDAVRNAFVSTLDYTKFASKDVGGIRMATIKSTDRTLLEESVALRANKKTFSSFMDDVGVEGVSGAVDAPFAKQMELEYPDAAIKRWETDIKDVETRLPKSEIDELAKMKKEAPDIADKVNDTKLARASDSILRRVLGNAATSVAGRFVALTLIGTTAGFLGHAVKNLIDASTGAHLNVRTLDGGVVSYKMVDFSCKNPSAGNGSIAAHPFRSEIDSTIESNEVDFESKKGAYVYDGEGNRSKTRANAPICGTLDAKAGNCGRWAVYEVGSVLPWVSPMSSLPPGTSLSCDNGMSVSEAVCEVFRSAGMSVLESALSFSVGSVKKVLGSLVDLIVNTSIFVIGIPVVAGVGAARHDLKNNWRHGAAVAFGVLLLILVVRFFVSSGFLTLRWLTSEKDSKHHQNALRRF